MEHQLQKLGSKWYRCSLCQWEWQSKPKTDCPGVPRYDWGSKPEHLLSAPDLKKQNLKYRGKPVGCIWLVKSTQWLWLYDKNEAVTNNPDQPPVYTWDNRPDDLLTANQLAHRNLKPLPKSELGIIWSDRDRDFVGLYEVIRCEKIDPDLPPYTPRDSNPELKTEKELRQMNLSAEGVKPRGFYRYGYDKYGNCTTVLLYHPNDCNWKASDRYITKTTLKQTYLLSYAWIKRLGEPDIITDNPHHHKFSAMQLYSKQRVERFLADNAPEYACWLDERDRYIVIFELNRERIEAGRAAARERSQTEEQRRIRERERHRLIKRMSQHEFTDALTTEEIREQTTRCLRCASGCASLEGFLCVIHPMGLQVHQIPCPDWTSR